MWNDFRKWGQIQKNRKTSSKEKKTLIDMFALPVMIYRPPKIIKVFVIFGKKEIRQDISGRTLYCRNLSTF